MSNLVPGSAGIFTCMSFRISLSAASVLILVGAATAQVAEARETTPITGTEWYLADAQGAFFMLNDDATIGGNDGCNVFGGEATLDGDTLTVGNLASTMRFCDLGVSLTGILDGTNTVSVEGDTLTLTDDQGTRWSFHSAT